MPREPHAWFRQQTGWWMTTINRTKIKLVKGKDRKAEANKKLRELLTMRDHNPAPESGELTVAAVIDLYLTHAKTKLSELSLYNRKLYMQSFAEAHGWRKVNDKDCLPFHLTSWLDAHPEWGSDWTKNHAVAVIHRPFNWAAKQRLIAANPFRGVSHRAGAPRRPMTDAEFEALLLAAESSRKPTVERYPGGRKVCPSDRKRRQGTSAADRFRELLRFLRLTGARPGEAAKLEWEHIDLGAAVIVLTVHKTSRTQKTKKPRVIPLTQEVVDLLTAIRLRNEPGPRVFSTHRGTPWNRCNLSLRMRRSREKAGIPEDAKLYGLRHAFGTRAIVNGVDIKTLAELLGHSTVRMSEHYVHLAGQRTHLHDAMRKVSPPPAPPAVATPPEGDQHRDSETPPPPSGLES
jgi:integrase